MADISAEIAAFQSAKYGEDVRDSMVSLANKVNDEVEAATAAVEENTQEVEGFSLTIGTVTTLPSTDSATATISGSGYDLELNLGIPKGADGGVAGDISQNAVNFADAATRENLATGQTLAVGFGKIKKWLGDLKAAAFQYVANDLATEAEGYVLDARQGAVLGASVASNASAIQGLQTLCSGAVKTGYVQVITSSTNIAAGGHTNDLSVAIPAITGYTPVMVSPRNTGAQGMIHFYKCYINGSNVVISLANPRTSSVTVTSAYVNLLYVKTDMVG